MKIWNGKAKTLIKELIRGVAVFVGAGIIMEALEVLFGITFKWSVVAAIWVLYYLLRYCIKGR